MVVGLLPELTMLRANNAHLGMNTSIDGLGIIILISMDIPGLYDNVCYGTFLWHTESKANLQLFETRNDRFIDKKRLNPFRVEGIVSPVLLWIKNLHHLSPPPTPSIPRHSGETPSHLDCS